MGKNTLVRTVKAVPALRAYQAKVKPPKIALNAFVVIMSKKAVTLINQKAVERAKILVLETQIPILLAAFVVENS